MKKIVSTISLLLLITGSFSLDTFLSDLNKDIPTLIKECEYEPVSVQLSNKKTESLPFDKSHTEKKVEGAHVQKARFASVRKIFSRHTYFASFSFLNKQSVSGLLISIKPLPNYSTYTVNNLPIHIRNCIWLL